MTDFYFDFSTIPSSAGVAANPPGGPASELFGDPATIAFVASLCDGINRLASQLFPVLQNEAARRIAGTDAGVSEDVSVDLLTVGGALVSDGLVTGTAPTAFCALRANDQLLYHQAAPYRFTAGMWIPSVSDDTDTFTVRAGLFSDPSSAVTDGLFFRNGASNWEAVTMRATSNVTATDTGVPVDTGYHRFDIAQQNGEAEFSIDGTVVATPTTNRPADDTAIVSAVGIYKSTGTDARAMLVDPWAWAT